MKSDAHYISVFDTNSTSEAEWQAMNLFDRSVQAEQWPDEPPKSIDETKHFFRRHGPLEDVRYWAAYRNDGVSVVGLASVSVWNGDNNRHLASFSIDVLPEMRRKGMGRQLLGNVASRVVEAQRTLMTTYTDSTMPDGEGFLKRLGGRAVKSSFINELEIKELNREAINRWLENGPVHACGFELGMWRGRFPDESLEEVAAMMQVMNTEPRDDLEVEDTVWTPDMVRQSDDSLIEKGIIRWTIYARHIETGKIAGYTEVFWNPIRPERLDQGDTGVFLEYRNRGIARWLKATMIEKALEERPNIRTIRTYNAASNAPMLRINYEMGFKRRKVTATWQITLEQAQKYLSQYSN